MSKRQSIQHKKKDRRKKYGWLLCILALIFIQVSCGAAIVTELTKIEKNSMKGLYIAVGEHTINTAEINLNEAGKIEIPDYQFTFETKKYTDSETFSKYSKIDDKYCYLKEANGKSKVLVISSDGTLYVYEEQFWYVFYKINGTRTEVEGIIQPYKEKKCDMKSFSKDEDFKHLETELDNVIKPFQRMSALQQTSTINSNDYSNKQNDDYVVYYIFFLGTILILCVYCTYVVNLACNCKCDKNSKPENKDESKKRTKFSSHPNDYIICINNLKKIQNQQKSEPIHIDSEYLSSSKSSGSNITICLETYENIMKKHFRSTSASTETSKNEKNKKEQRESLKTEYTTQSTVSGKITGPI